MLLVLITIALIILVVASFKYPPISLGLFLTANFFKLTLMLKYRFFRVVDYTVLCAVLVLITMAYSFIRGSARLKDIISIPVLLYLLLAISLLLGTTYTSAPHYGLEKSSRFATLTFIAFLAPIVFAYSLKQIKLMIWIVFAVGIIFSIFIIIFPQIAVLREGAEARAGFLEAGPLGTATRIAGASIIAFVFAIMVHTSLHLKIINLALIILTVVAIIMTGSRGPFLGLVFTWVAAILICRRVVSKAWVSVIIGVILIGMLASFSRLPEIATARIATAWKSSYHAREAIYVRTEMFSWTTKRSMERPILGHGTGAFAVDRGGQDIRSYPHNIILELLYEQGLVGVVILTLFLWFIFRRWRQTAQFVHLCELDIGTFQIVHIAGLLFLFMLTQSMKSGDIDWNRIMFFCAGLVIAMFNYIRRSVEEIYAESELITDDWQQLQEVGFEDEVLY